MDGAPLLRRREREERMRLLAQRIHRRLRHVMAGDREESDLGARLVDLARDGLPRAAVARSRPLEIDHGNALAHGLPSSIVSVRFTLSAASRLANRRDFR